MGTGAITSEIVLKKITYYNNNTLRTIFQTVNTHVHYNTHIYVYLYNILTQSCSRESL